jgi:hypothetical protein
MVLSMLFSFIPQIDGIETFRPFPSISSRGMPTTILANILLLIDARFGLATRCSWLGTGANNFLHSIANLDEGELIDPSPDLHELFQTFNLQFFHGRLAGVEVRWSARMTTCAGIWYGQLFGQAALSACRPVVPSRF